LQNAPGLPSQAIDLSIQASRETTLMSIRDEAGMVGRPQRELPIRPTFTSSSPVRPKGRQHRVAVPATQGGQTLSDDPALFALAVDDVRKHSMCDRRVGHGG
jgi:hypothetical protein